MEDNLVRIQGMNDMFNIPCPEQLTDCGPERLAQFHQVLIEEVDELRCCDSKGAWYETTEHALIGDKGTDFVALADNLADIIVYTLSEAKRWGIPIEKIFNAVMNSQETKLVDGKALWSSDGSKFIKGPDYIAPEAEIRKMLSWHLPFESGQFGTENNDPRSDSQSEY